jgi:predicted Zn-dependent peptidase
MLRGSLLDPEELARERNVVLEEIKRHKDTPEESVHDVFAEALWGSHPLGLPVIGTARSVGAMQREDVVRYIESRYAPNRIVVAAAGNVPHADVVALAERYLGDLTGTIATRGSNVPQASGRTLMKRKRTAQVHFCLGATGCSQTSDDRYSLMTLDTVLGGNMSSRLFQEIREKRGLAYAIGSYAVSYTESGMFVIHGGTSAATFDEVLELTHKELDTVRQEGLTDDEINKSRTQLRGNLMLGLESMSNRMMRMGKSMLYFGRVPAIDEILTKIEAVSAESIARVAGAALDESAMTLAAIGPFDPKRAEG